MKKKIMLQATVPEDLANQRLDVILAQLFSDYSRSRLQSWIKEGFVKIDDKVIKQTKEKIAGHSAISIEAELENQTAWFAQEIAITPVYCDEHIIVINKPAGLVVHPAAGNYEGTLVNALLHQFPELAQLPRAGIVHRLDKETTGLMVVARSLIAHASLVEQLQQRTMSREYIAVVRGAMLTSGKVDAPIGRHPSQRTKMAVVHNGKPARTFYQILERFHQYTLLRLKLESGRTHQIRVHMAYCGYPLVGDPVYGGRLVLPKGASATLIEMIKNFHRQALHAQKLTILHPALNELMSWEAEIPDDMQALIETLRQEEKNAKSNK
jgi:23S rRNA pseudouridine1911/1915/1917 synthase